MYQQEEGNHLEALASYPLTLLSVEESHFSIMPIGPRRKAIGEKAVDKQKTGTNRLAEVLASRINGLPENAIVDQLNLAADQLEYAIHASFQKRHHLNQTSCFSRRDGKTIQQLKNQVHSLKAENESLRGQLGQSMAVANNFQRWKFNR